MNKCKRMTVIAIGLDINGNVEYGRNGSKTECKNIIGACGCIHAEIDLLNKMPKAKEVILSHSPCLNCAKALVNVGVEKVTYRIEYRKKEGIEYLKENGVTIKAIGEVDSNV